eukprot:SAG11_NODE_55_length_19449_cov_28.630135_11_plen_70_part_00
MRDYYSVAQQKRWPKKIERTVLSLSTNHGILGVVSRFLEGHSNIRNGRHQRLRAAHGLTSELRSKYEIQ